VHKRKHYLLNKVSLTKEFSTEISVGARGGELGRQHNYVVITVIIPIGLKSTLSTLWKNTTPTVLFIHLPFFPLAPSFAFAATVPGYSKFQLPKVYIQAPYWPSSSHSTCRPRTFFLFPPSTVIFRS